MALQQLSCSSEGQEAFLLRRPGTGTFGNSMLVYANHFRVRFRAKLLFHYDVTIEPEPPKGLHRAIMEQAVHRHREKLRGALPAYDGQRALYTARELPDQQVDMEIELVEAGPRRRNNSYKITLREASRIDTRLLHEYLAGRHRILPQESLQALDIVLREAAVKSYVPRGRCFFGGRFDTRSLGGGIEAYRGYYQSIRPAQNGLLSLNIDIAAAPFLEAICLHDFLAKAFRMDMRDLNRELARPDEYGNRARVKAKKLLKGIRVETVHNAGAKRKYRITGISNEPLQNLRFDMDGVSVSVMDYFFRTYSYKIIFPGLPAVEANSRDKRRYLPMEVCKIVDEQPFMKSMTKAQKDGLLQVTCISALERREATVVIGRDVRKDTYGIANEFGVEINSKLTQIPARVLPPPSIQYRLAPFQPPPHLACWKMMNKKMVRGCRINRWSLVNFSDDVREEAVVNFCKNLPDQCETYGLTMNPEMAVGHLTQKRPDAEGAIKLLNRQCVEKFSQNLDLLICIIPEKDNKLIYAAVKRVCEIELGVVTQCCLSKHVKSIRQDYIENLLLKINAKMGGNNSWLVDEHNRRLPLISEVPSIIIGADVSHPTVGDDQGPSISAVTASMDWPYFSQYEAIVQTQRQREEVCEEFFWEREDQEGTRQTGGIMKDLLCAFSENQGCRPERIIYYRDGVSEGEFQAVLKNEYEAIKKACVSLGWGSRLPGSQNNESQSKKQRAGDSLPKITVIVVQKRHHTRFLPEEGRGTKNGNILPGTIVDSVICHPTHFDFYLCSHFGIKGTSRPAHYHVLKDENGFTVDQIQRLTNDLCFTYARCTRAVSVVPPCYYAHLAAKRARVWLEVEGSDQGSQHDRASTASGGGATHSRTEDAAALARPLPLPHDRIRTSMFYI